MEGATIHEEEAEDAEWLIRRAWRMYRSKGRDEGWIRRRLQGIAVREELTDAWREAGVTKSEDFRMLTEELSRATFGLIPSEHKRLKNLSDQENPRDHMTGLELIFTMLGEAMTIEILKARHPSSVEEVTEIAREGGELARKTKEALEWKTDRNVVSPYNFKR